ncbi:hypothetical protein [Terriglobus roseus]|uniref:Uncharacterized protein n=1 Tax=Terriglobus roseus TaxID=392734 RepID=A0A1G7FII7_9BACT|nr:hypothetical protein [Terriglobus roseus]SDE75691.1 hypothetical protein SAMN05444167_0349 [Terriglobus roseus]
MSSQMLRLSLSVAAASALVIPGILVLADYFMSDSPWLIPFAAANLPGLVAAFPFAILGIGGHNAHDPSLVITAFASAVFWAMLFYYLLGKKLGKAS